MNIYLKSILNILVTMVFTLSCSVEKTFDEIHPQETPTFIMFDVATRGDIPADCNITDFRVLIYQYNNGELMWNIPITDALPADHISGTLQITTGTFDFVFIANETGLYNGANLVDLSDNSSIDHISKLNNLTFDRGAFGFHKEIPMVRVFKRVEVANNNKIKTSEMNDYHTGAWDVEMERVAIKLDLKITLTEQQYMDWDQKITINNIPGKAYLFAEKDNSSFAKAFGYEIDILSGYLSSEPIGTDYMFITCTKNTLLPELYLTPANNIAQKGMVVEMEFGGVVKSAVISCEADNYAIPRNTWLTLNATVKEDEITLVAQLLPWSDAGLDDVDFDGQYRFRVDQSEVIFTHLGGSKTIELFTDYPDGWKVESVTSGGWIAWPTTAAFGSPNSYTPLSITCLQNFGSEDRTGFIVIRAGNLRQTIKVIQKAVGLE